MRRLLIFGVIAATTALAPLAGWAGNQEFADQIAANLRSSGQLTDYKIAVRAQDGTVWLQGRVRDQEQMARATKLVCQMPGVARVVNNLTIGDTDASAATASGQTAAPASGMSATMNKISSALNPLRRSDATSTADKGARQAGYQTPYASAKSRGLVPVAMQEPIAPPPPGKDGGAVMEGAPPAAMPMTPNGVPGGPVPMYAPGVGGAPAPTRYDQPYMPNYAWPSYAAYPNYAALTYPRQYSPTAWPYIGPFYPYPQVPLGWRKVSLEWSDGWWQLDFHDKPCCAWWR